MKKRAGGLGRDPTPEEIQKGIEEIWKERWERVSKCGRLPNTVTDRNRTRGKTPVDAYSPRIYYTPKFR